jgi:hypothetical protein
MDRVRINISNLRNPRFDAEFFSFTVKEKKAISNGLNKIEAMIPEKSEAIFSITKFEGLFKGSLKIDSHNIFTYGKNSSAIALFNILRKRVEKNILMENQMCIVKENRSLGSLAPKKIKSRELLPINLNLKPRLK